MPITLRPTDLQQALERAYALAIGSSPLPPKWIDRSHQLSDSPSVANIAAVGAVLLARATDQRIDPFVLQAKEGSPGAFNLRAAASALAGKRRAFQYDIGSTSDRDPINAGTFVSYTRWDLALDRIREDHKPFFQLILTWLQDISQMSDVQASEALAAYIRVRRQVVQNRAGGKTPATVSRVPSLTNLVDAVEAFASSNSGGGASAMALVAAAYRVVGFDASLPSRNDPRRLDITMRRGGDPVIGVEVKQVDTSEDTADSLAADAAEFGVDFALLAVFRPGSLVNFDRGAVVRRAEKDRAVVLRVAYGVRELMHEALVSGAATQHQFRAAFPGAFAEALQDIRVPDPMAETWDAIASQWI